MRKSVPQLSKENLTANQPSLDVVARYAAEKNVTNAQISLAWMLRKYPNASTNSRSKNHQRIPVNPRASEIELTEAKFTALEQALEACKVYGYQGHVETEQNPGFAFSKQHP